MDRNLVEAIINTAYSMIDTGAWTIDKDGESKRAQRPIEDILKDFETAFDRIAKKAKELI